MGSSMRMRVARNGWIYCGQSVERHPKYGSNLRRVRPWPRMLMLNSTATILRVGLWAGILFGALGGFSRVEAQTYPAQFANALTRAHYTVYVGDVNGDGIVDLLLVPKKNFVVIDLGDISFPILVRPPSPPFVLLSGGGSYTLSSNPAASVLNSTVWQAGSYSLTYGDTLGRGSLSMLLQPLTAGQPSVLIDTSASTGLPVLLETLNSSTIGADLSASGTVVSLQDINGDHRADLIVYTGQYLTTALVASADGTFTPPDAASGGPALAAWRALCAALAVGDASSAVNRLSSTAGPQYSIALTALGGSQVIATIPLNWSEPQLVMSTSDMAEFVVSQTENGVLMMHYVTVLNEFGNWLVDSF